MGYFRSNKFSHWLNGEHLKDWADRMELPMTDDKPNLAWVDIETTGLDKQRDIILNLGIVLTNEIGEVCQDGAIEWLVFPCVEPEDVLRAEDRVNSMDQYVKDMHTKNGLLSEIGAALNMQLDDLDTRRVSADAAIWMTQRCGMSKSDDALKVQFSGSSPHFDRGFIENQMLALNDWFHYRNGVDISGIREVARRINPTVLATQPVKLEKHRPLPDLADSIRLYRHILQAFLIPDQQTTLKMNGIVL